MADNSDLRSELQTRLSDCQSSWRSQYKQMGEALAFASGDQWSEEQKRKRTEAGMPMMVSNFTKPQISRVVNPFRLAPFAPEFGSDDADVAELLQGWATGLQSSKRISEKAEIALENAVTCGIGWICLGVDYDSADGLDRDITVYSPLNPLTVWIDPLSEEVDGSDAEYGFTIRYLSAKLAEARHGKDLGDAAFGIDLYGDWPVPTDCVADVVFYRIKRETVKRYWLPDGTATYDKPEMFIAERSVERKSVECYRFIGNKLIYETKLPIPAIPIFPVYGDRINIDGVRYVGIPWWVRDSQRMVNYYASAEAELAALAPRSPFVAEEGQVEGNESDWAQANVRAIGLLKYKAVSVNGHPIGPPSRMDNAAQTGGLIQSRAAAQQDMSRETNLFDATFGAAGAGDASGLAVLRNQSAGEVGSAQYADNLRKSLLQMWRIIAELAVSVYDTPRRTKIINAQGEATYVPLAMGTVLATAAYDIDVSSGPVHESRKKEGQQALLALGQIMQEKVGFIADLFVDTLPVPNARAIAARLKATLPPEILQPSSVDPQAQAALQQAEATIGELQTQNKFLEDAVRQLQGALMVATEANETKLAVAQINAEADLAQEQIKQVGMDKRLAAEIAADNHAQNKDIIAKAASDDQKLIGSAIPKARVAGPLRIDSVEPEQAPPTDGQSGMLAEE